MEKDFLLEPWSISFRKAATKKMKNGARANAANTRKKTPNQKLRFELGRLNRQKRPIIKLANDAVDGKNPF